MSLLDKIEQLEKQRLELEQQKKELVEKRKIQIGDLALKLHLLDADDGLCITSAQMHPIATHFNF